MFFLIYEFLDLPELVYVIMQVDLVYYIRDGGSRCMKRKVILYIAVSVDGFIADEKGGVDWLLGHDKEDTSDYGYGEFARGIDTVIMGKTTYEQIAFEISPDKWMYEDLTTYVLTHKQYEDKENIHFIEADAYAVLDTLKQKPGKDIWICGGANMIHPLLEKDAIDELQISIIPTLLGKGIPLFQERSHVSLLELIEHHSENGILLTTYRVKH